MNVPDITECYKSSIREGEFILKFSSGIEIIQEARSIIKREEYPDVLWIEPESIVKRTTPKIDSAKIVTINALKQEQTQSVQGFLPNPYMFSSGILLLMCLVLIIYIIRLKGQISQRSECGGTIDDSR